MIKFFTGLCMRNFIPDGTFRHPDFIIVRRDPVSKYVIDILEPHRPDLDDNLGKAKGFAEYARQTSDLDTLFHLLRVEPELFPVNGNCACLPHPRQFDAFGETVDNYYVHNLFTTTDTDVDRQFRIAESKLGNEGIGNIYGNKYEPISRCRLLM